MAGRGWGKTRVGAEAVHLIAERYPGLCGSRILVAGRTAADVRDTMVEGVSGLLATAKPWFRPTQHATKNLLVYPNGVRVNYWSADQPVKFRGPQFGFAWLDEVPHWQRAEDSWDQIQFGLRAGKDPKCIVTTTPLPTPLMRDLADHKDTRLVCGETMDNFGNMPSKFFEKIYGAYEGSELGDQELRGILLDDSTTALWSSSMIRRIDYGKLPQLFRIVVAIDPAGGSTKKENDETGIAVCAIDAHNNFFVLDDLSGRYEEKEWARLAIQAANQWGADKIIGEKNYGGNMVRSIVQMHPDFAHCRARCEVVTATVSKEARARMISTIYSQGRGYHVGEIGSVATGEIRKLVKLEFQMTKWDPNVPRKDQKFSPDRMDAMVWAGLELLGDGTDRGEIRPGSGALVEENGDVVLKRYIDEIQGDNNDFLYGE